MKFSDLSFDPSLLSCIEKLSFQECTPIQEQVMPLILQGKDVAGLAQTGTGKTAAFLLPLMERIVRARPAGEVSEETKALIQQRAFKDWRSQNFILILVPTRELAEQVYENVGKFSEVNGLRAVSIYGGTGYEKQKEGLRNSVEFVVATPGRLIDLYKENLVDLKQVRAIVFDEADRMFDMGFKDDMKYILQRVPRERQFLVFSATLNFDVLNTAYQFGADPVEINVSRDQAKAENVKDGILHVGQVDKPQYLLSLLKKHNPNQAMIFSNFKFSVERIAQFLNKNGVPAMGISSLLTQAQRNRVLEQFKAVNEKNILVATDVAARGLDVKGVDMVINFDLPQDAESYVHRIGRTGRAGTEGTAISLVGDRDVESLERIQNFLKHKLEVGWLEDTDLIKDFKPFPNESSGPPRSFDQRPREGGGGGHRGGPRRDGPRRDGPRRDGPRRDGPGGPRHDNRSAAGHTGSNGAANGKVHSASGGEPGQGGQQRRDHGPRKHASGGGRPHRNDSRPHNRPNTSRPQGGKGPHPHRRPPPKAAAPQSGLVKKVSGFIKRLFG